MIHYSGISFSQPARQSVPDSLPAKRKLTVTFLVDLSTELKNVRSLSSIGIRGNEPPLSWVKTWPMTRTNKNGLYETTLTFETTAPTLHIKYKYFHDTASWESSVDRVIDIKNPATIVPVDHWNEVLPTNTQAYHDSLEALELYNTIASLDSMLFDAYNHCNLEKYASLFSEDLEFYHDKGGLTTSKKDMVEAVKNNICGKVTRELAKGSIEVSPIPGYGAVEMGSHRFHNLKEGSISRFSKFVVIWQKKNGEWKVTRVISLH
jgi:ribosomal protein S17E